MKTSLVIVTTSVVCAAVSVLGLALWSKAGSGSAARVAADPIVVGTIPSADAVLASVPVAVQKHSVSPPAVFSVSNFSRKTVCLVERGAALTSRSRDFFASPDCEHVWPGLTRATNWTQNEDASVTITDGHGRTVLTLVRGRHFSYEAAEDAADDLALLMLP